MHLANVEYLDMDEVYTRFPNLRHLFLEDSHLVVSKHTPASFKLLEEVGTRNCTGDTRDTSGYKPTDRWFSPLDDTECQAPVTLGAHAKWSGE